MARLIARVNMKKNANEVWKALISSAAKVPLGKGKYHNQKVHDFDGTFDSKGEYRRWLELKDEWKHGLINNLQRQVKFSLSVTTAADEGAVGSYIADFVYEDNLFHPTYTTRVIEDYKGVQTDVFKLKWKMMHILYGREFQLCLSGPRRPARRPKVSYKKKRPA